MKSLRSGALEELLVLANDGISVDIGDQVVGCCHPDCLSLAEFMAGAFIEDSWFEIAPTCLPHVGWAIEFLVRRLADEPGARFTVVRVPGCG